MIILKSDEHVSVCLHKNLILKTGISDQGKRELSDEYKRYTIHQKVQGVIIPHIYSFDQNVLTMEYIYGNHTASDQKILETYKKIPIIKGRNLINWSDWKWLIDKDLGGNLCNESKKILFEVIEKVSDFILLSPPVYGIYCHGDLHQKNTLRDGSRLFIFDPKPLWMPIMYDIAYFSIMQNTDTSCLLQHIEDKGLFISMLAIASLRKCHVYAHRKDTEKIDSLLERRKKLMLSL